MKKYKLGDIATVEISGVDKKITDGEKEIRLCNFVDVYYNWAITIAQHDSFMLATARPNEISKFQLKKGQVALTKDSETRDDIGISTYIADDFENVILGYHCALISPNKDILDGCYLNALLHTDYAKKYFACNASGSGQRYALSVEALNSFPVPIIPLHEQKQIGEIFSALDKKIELNRQINPHFLFNTLNTLYGLVITKSDLTESAFVKFSNILKYMYHNASVEKIDVKSEIEYIRQYVELQQLRLNHHTKVIFESHTDQEYVKIPPMILITFVENAFKYGTSSSEDCTVLIRIVVEDGTLLFKTCNSIMREKEQDSPSIGIENCRKRLRLLYPERFTLLTEKDENKREFRTKLIIQLS